MVVALRIGVDALICVGEAMTKTIYDQATAAMPPHEHGDYPNDSAAHDAFRKTAERLMNINSGLLDGMRQSHRPVIRDEQGVLHFIRSVDIRKVSFMWNPKLGEVANGLVEIGRIKTLHGYGYYGFFKPSIAEFLSQLPVEGRDKIVAFETIGPDTAADMNKEYCALNAGYHVATTILYGR